MDVFDIPVTYNQRELTFKAHSVRAGYVNHIHVNINDTHIIIGRDQEGNFRALVDPERMKEGKIDVELAKTWKINTFNH